MIYYTKVYFIIGKNKNKFTSYYIPCNDFFYFINFESGHDIVGSGCPITPCGLSLIPGMSPGYSPLKRQ